MTEKRFTIKEFSTLDAMSSLDVICDNGIELPSSTACDLLNELSDENEQLKSIKKFADRNGICIFNIDEAFRRCWQDNAKLVKENEQLKKDCTILIHHNQDYRKENEQLKADKQSLIDFIKKEFPKSHKHILEGFE